MAELRPAETETETEHETETESETTKAEPTVQTQSSATTRWTKTLFSLSLLLFSISLLSFAGTVVRHNNVITTTTTTSTSGNVTAIACDCSCSECADSGDVSSSSSSSQTEMLIGYKILHHTLKKESQLRFLHWLRDATFRGPTGSLKEVMTTIYKTSNRRKRELDTLMKKETPVVRLKDAPVSAMGDSIQTDVEDSSTAELVPLPFGASSAASSAANKTHSGLALSSSASPLSSGVVSEWGVRFLLIQGQATRMVVALSTSLLRFDPSPERREWLTALADEYEAIREDIVECLSVHLGGGVDNGHDNNNNNEQ